MLISRIDDAVKDGGWETFFVVFGKFGLLGFVLHIFILYELELCVAYPSN